MAANKEKITWITCPDCGSKIGIVISVGKPETVKPLQEPSPPEAAPQTGEELLKAAGIDTLQLVIEEDETQIVATPKKFLGDLWGPMNDKIRALGGTWIRDGRNSHWEIPKDRV